MYKVTIGLEVHCELKTNSKVFSKATNTYSDIPNSITSVVDLGMPGTLPVVNKEACRKALKAAIALNCQNPDVIMFDRKNYYYPDLPKGYQITQMTKPMGINGYLDIEVNDEIKRVDITQLHLEEDTASLDHYLDYSLLNYNRSGIPLIEIVTEPCMHSPDEALTFLESLRSIFLYCEISEARSDLGQMRCDINISLSKDDTLGCKVEIKNVNSFNNVKDAIYYEIERQTELLNRGEKVIQETRRFDDESRTTIHMRTKVDTVDYKYFIDPNLPPITIAQAWLDEIKKEIPMLQLERRDYYIDNYNLSKYDATVLVKTKEVADYFEECIKIGMNSKIASNWVSGMILSIINNSNINISDFFIKPQMLNDLVKLIDEGKISLKQGKEVFYKSLDSQKEPIKIVEELNIMQISDTDTILNLVIETLNENLNVVNQYDPNNPKVIDYFVGQIMKKTRGKTNPNIAFDMVKTEIEKMKQ